MSLRRYWRGVLWYFVRSQWHTLAKNLPRAKDTKIDIQAARDIALKARPGKTTDEELEKEKGGCGLRYSFDIKVGSKTYEVGVDAITGKLLENKREGKHPD